ncbi:uncharacterized protein LOC111400141 [Olea europaea var. sylvestris]|uniref:uncharacterized protein LOC111400141 n=1 Tax=Olea europaea var. sylvestris TaxID=158386 RepID=UPI000C1D3142|nr:uncharacterized protein LOC111400141 [Olea europaea var. sylvestris]
MEQGAFIPRRSIFDNITLPQEMIHYLHKPVRGGNVVLKVDIAKAYDRIDWDFLMHVLRSFGLSRKICDLVRQCVTSPWYFVMMNGTMKGFFKGGRGGSPNFSSTITISRRRMLLRLTRFTEGKFPFKYLGVPIITGRLRTRDLEEVVEKFRMRLAGWQSRVLSKEARLLLLKHVLTSIPLHLISCIKAPFSVIKVINRIFSDFFWGYADGKPKRKWVAWDKICMPFKEGGAGLRSLHEV